MPGRIVTYAHRDKRPPRKKQAAVSLTGPAVVTRKASARATLSPPPANDDRPSLCPPVTSRSRRSSPRPAGSR